VTTDHTHGAGVRSRSSGTVTHSVPVTIAIDHVDHHLTLGDATRLRNALTEAISRLNAAASGAAFGRAGDVLTAEGPLIVDGNRVPAFLP
jgi:hypothetical protein